MRVAGRGDDARRLVEDVDLERLGRHRLAVNQHAARLVDVAGGIRDHLVPHLHAPGPDELLGGAARRDAGVREVLRESQRFLRLAA